MLFNSYAFLFLFLPATCFLFYLCCGWRRITAAAAVLAGMSVLFYGYWAPKYIVLLLASVVVNYFGGNLLIRAREQRRWPGAKSILTIWIVANLGVLCYFKYANFFIDSLRAALGTHWQIGAIILPIGISFFTFTQIAYLVDTYQGKVRETRFLHYLLFVTYFPHLIAGPVLHHAEMMPQFARSETYRFQLHNVLSGTTLLMIGLFKKVILADGIQPFVAPVFDGVHHVPLSGLEAWSGALAYSMQLYFDFSGYSDMAIGLSRLFNVELPLNFNSPYKSTSIIEFWRRWHMTLSRFLRDYLYIPLGGNKLGPVRRYINLMLTMVLGGLWHGAGWTFAIWGALHGLYLAINHGWHAIRAALGWIGGGRSRWSIGLSILVTFIAVTLAWTFFRAKTLAAALDILSAMAGHNGWALPAEWQPALESLPGLRHVGLSFGSLSAFAGLRQLLWIAVLLLIAWRMPNSQELMATMHKRVLSSLRPSWSWVALGSVLSAIGLLAVINFSHGVSEFIYFNF